jgi:uncharacterized protein
MKLAIVSDIHDHLWNLRAALSFIRTADVAVLICCGDLCSPFVVGVLAQGFAGPVHAVAGNNEGDWRQIMVNAATANQNRGATAQLTFHGQFFQGEFGGKRVAVNHYPDIAVAIGAAKQHDLVCFGHDHQYAMRGFGKTLALNPGTLMGYNPLKAGDSKEVTATFAIFDTGASDEQAVAFYQIVTPWRSPADQGTVDEFEVQAAEDKP